MSELFLKNYYNSYNLYAISYNQFIYTNIHIHTTIGVDLLALSRHSNLFLSTFCLNFFQLCIPICSYIFGLAPLAGPWFLRSPSLLNQVTHSDMILLKCT